MATFGSKTLPTIQKKKGSEQKLGSNIFRKSEMFPATTHKKVLLLNGKITNKQDIFETIRYFKTLSGNKGEIKMKQFCSGFEKKPFMKKQVSSLYKYFDEKQKGAVEFQDFLKVYYRNITK